MPTLPIQVRGAAKTDIPFITSSWLRSYRDGYLVRAIPNTVYYYQHHKILEHLLPRSIVLVACNEQDPDQILGWICAEVIDTALVVHYVYTKQPFRKFGIAKRLVDLLQETEQPPAVMVTHNTQMARPIIKAKKWIYNPYLLFSTLPADWSYDEEESNQ